MANYTDRDLLNTVHGKTFIDKYAAITGTNNTTEMTDRIDYFCTIATAYVNGRLRLSRYDVPFNGVPKIIQYMTTLLAGLLLYDGHRERGQTSRGDEQVHKRKEFSRLLRQILCGQLKLEHPTSGELLGTDYSSVPSTFSGDLNYCCCSKTCHNDICYCTNCIERNTIIYCCW